MYHVLCQFLEKGPTEYKQYINQRQQGGKKEEEKKVKLKQNTNLKSMLLLILGN